MKKTNTRSASRKVTHINEGYSAKQRKRGSSVRRRNSSSAERRTEIHRRSSYEEQMLHASDLEAVNTAPEVVDIQEHVKKREKKEKQKQKLKFSLEIGGLDVPFLMLVIMLSLVGLVMLFSASYSAAYYKYGDSLYFIWRQALYTIGGFAVMILVANIPYQIYHKLAFIALGVAFVLLILVLLIGDTYNNATRWLNIAGISFQPSEIAKAAVIISFSSLVIRMGDRMKTFVYGVIPFLAILLMMAALLMKQPHLSATIIICATGIVILFLGGAHIGKLAVLGIIGVAGALWLVLGMGYGMDRINVWLDPTIDPLGDGFQSLQSFYAIGSGGLWGLGLGQSRQKHLFIPEPYNDFIFAIVCEELGFIGAVLIIILFAALVIRGYYIALRAKNLFGTLLAAGVITQIALQTFFNIGVVTGLLPVTGASLPFFSSGGTSTIILFAEMGIVLSVSKQILAPARIQREQNKKQKERKSLSEEIKSIR